MLVTFGSVNKFSYYCYKGGLTSEWISLVLKELYGPEQGLFKLSYNEICLYPNPFSYIIPNHLAYFRLFDKTDEVASRLF